MCHRSVGLIQNTIESMNMSTVSVSLKPEITLGVGVPRAAYLRFPLGNPMGEPHEAELQTSILRDVLEALEAAEKPNTVFELPYRWRRGRIGDRR
jgi:hypothetical protein